MGASNELSEYLAGLGRSRFTPKPWYNSAGDFVEFHFNDQEYHAERIDSFLTIYRSFESKEVVGFKLVSVKAIVQASEKYNLPPTRFSHLLCALMLGVGDPEIPEPYALRDRWDLYRDLIERYGDTPTPKKLRKAA